MPGIHTSIKRSNRSFFAILIISLVPLLVFIPRRLQGNTEAPVISLYEKSRSYAMIPLENATGDSSLDYLGAGILRMMISKAAPDSVYVSSPGLVFQTSPGGGEGDESIKSERLPLSVKILERKEEWNRLSSDRDYGNLARTVGADYILTGKYWLENEALKIELHYFDAVEYIHESNLHTTTVERVYDDLAGVSAWSRSRFRTGSTASVRVETETPGAMVYLDQIYLGRSPASGNVIPGKYRLTVEREGFRPVSKEISITPEKRNVFHIDDRSIPYNAAITVTSDPPGADVYLDMTYLGKTPLRAGGLPPGTHRLRASMEGMVDRFVGVVLEEGDLSREHVELDRGDTLQIYRDPGYAIMDWTWDELMISSGVSTLGFYGSWMYWQNRADDKEDSLRTMSSYNSITAIMVMDIQSFGLYEWYLLDKNNREAKKFKNYANISAGAGAFSFVLTGLFLWTSLEKEDREVGSVSWSGFIYNSGQLDNPVPAYGAGITFHF